MTQAERDRLVALKKAKKKLIIQKRATARTRDNGTTCETVASRVEAARRQGRGAWAARIAVQPQAQCRNRTGAGVPWVRAHTGRGVLGEETRVDVSRETARQWMIGAKLWRPRKQRIEKVHEWRPRRSRFGELVQWDTSPHDWVEGLGEEILLINMIDDATSRWFAAL